MTDGVVDQPTGPDSKVPLLSKLLPAASWAVGAVQAAAPFATPTAENDAAILLH
jgi:hypothetical protein